jgi:hypothetical protein
MVATRMSVGLMIESAAALIDPELVVHDHQIERPISPEAAIPF